MAVNRFGRQKGFQPTSFQTEELSRPYVIILQTPALNETDGEKITYVNY
jgi:hypothetical protein